MNNCSTKSCIVNIDREVNQINNYKNMLRTTINKINESGSKNNFILFVHGRGAHPEKAFNKNLISGLEAEYKAKVLMFHWQSKSGPAGFPEDKARESGIDLYNVFKETKEFKKDNETLVKNVNFILLTHSMGSIVLEESIKQTNSTVDNVFNTLVVSASASGGKLHKEWVDKLNISKNNYVLVNNNDPMLGFAGKKMKGRRLGRNLNGRFGRKFQLSNNVKYIDISRGDLEHRYYLKNDLKKTNYIKKFFKQVLTGNKAQLSNDNVSETRRNGMVFVLKK